MKTLERLIENTILASRWVLVVFYIGLAAALLIYALSFAKKLVETATHGRRRGRGSDSRCG